MVRCLPGRTAEHLPATEGLLWAYVAAVAFTRVMFGAHFPLDVLAGTALGTARALPVVIAFELTRRPAGRRRGRSWMGRPVRTSSAS